MLSGRNEIKLIELFKVCTKCDISKSWEEFHESKNGRFGVKPRCKTCNCSDSKKYRELHIKEHAIYSKKYRKANAAKIKIKQKAYYMSNKKEIDAKNSKWKTHNKEKAKSSYVNWYKINAKRISAKNSIWAKNNPEKVKAWKLANRDRINRQLRQQYKITPKRRLNRSISSAVYISLKGNKNGWHWETLVDYTLNKLKKHLEKQFTEGMAWNNYGKDGWVIDHKIPISVFNFTKPEHRDFKRCWALSNLQPMWFSDNAQKYAKITKHFQPSFLF